MRKEITVAVIIAAAMSSSAITHDLTGMWDFRRLGIDDWEWREVRVPHDWAIEGPFDEELNDNTGLLPWVAEGLYRKTFTLSADEAAALKAGGEAYLEFDGVMSRPAVKVNGAKAGGYTYGYLGFTLRIARLLKEGENTIEVKVDTTKQYSRFYCGGGIYRDVRLTILPKGHIVPGSVFIRTGEVGAEKADVVATWENDDGTTGRKEWTIDSPRLWDVDDPYLYETEIGGVKYRYGIRTCRFTKDGFYLNGRRLQLKGVCLHSDLGLLGMAFSKDAARRQLEIMRDMGVNAIRTAHNCPDPKYLDLCDEMGFVVWDECFDKWDNTAGWMGDVNLEEYIEGILRNFVRRDRNHPSVVVWSLGNEIPPQTADYYAGVEARRVRRFRDAVSEVDPTRQVGMADCYLENLDEYDALDVTGWNYQRKYNNMKLAHPEKSVLCSESGSGYSDYGYYGDGAPARWRIDYDMVRHQTCGYDHNAICYGDIPDPIFNRIEKDSYCCGEFVWTGMDYLGEPSPWIHWQDGVDRHKYAKSSSYGIVDLTGIPKDRFYLYRLHWNDRDETVHILPHWSWEGRAEKVTAMVYTSGDEAELFLNGKSLGRRQKIADLPDYPLEHQASFDTDPAYYDICAKYRLEWKDIAYEPGELKAVAYRNGERIGEETIRTAGRAERYVTELDQYSRETDEVLFYQVRAEDGNGTIDPWCDAMYKIEIEGPGEFVAAGSGDKLDRISFHSKEQKLYFGRSMVIVRRTGEGEIKVKVSVK